MNHFDPPSRRSPPQAPRSSNRRRAVVWGAFTGALLLPCFVFISWERKTLLAGESAWAALPLLPTAVSIPIGGMTGCVLGFCLWIVFSRRPIHPLYVSLAWAVSCFAISLPLYGLYWSAETSAGPSGGGLGSTMQAIGLFWNYVFFVLPTSVIGGLILGWIAGVVNRNRRYGDSRRGIGK